MGKNIDDIRDFIGNDNVIGVGSSGNDNNNFSNLPGACVAQKIVFGKALSGEASHPIEVMASEGPMAIAIERANKGNPSLEYGKDNPFTI